METEDTSPTPATAEQAAATLSLQKQIDKLAEAYDIFGRQVREANEALEERLAKIGRTPW